MSDRTAQLVSSPDVSITLVLAQPMITLRGDLTNPALIAGIKSLTGAAMPGTRRIETGPGGASAWMSPDELLVLPQAASPEPALAKLGEALSGHHALALDVSSARVMFTLTGPHVRNVLAKGAPVDLHPEVFLPGDFRRTRLGQIAVAFGCIAPHQFHLVCFRSLAGAMSDWLANAARVGESNEIYR